MFKKIMLITSCLIILVLTACGYNSEIPPTMTVEATRTREEIGYVTLPAEAPVGTTHLSIQVATEEMLAEIVDEDFLMIDFAAATGGFVTEGITLIVNTSDLVSGFTIGELGDLADYGTNTQFIITNFPIGQAASISYELADGYQNTYNFAVNISGELGTIVDNEQWDDSDEGADVTFEDIEIDLDGDDAMPMLDPIEKVSILLMEPYICDEESVDVSYVLSDYIYDLELELIQLFDYENVFFSRPMAELNRMALPAGDFLLIQATAEITNIEILSLEVTDGLFQMNFSVVERFEVAENLLPTEALVIYNYRSVGMFPLSGITFIDAYGVRHYYLIFQDHSDEFPPYRLIPFTPYES